MMADRFIDQLNELTDPATGDLLVIEDVSAGETKKIHPGTATFRDVQTSPTDTTAGRLMAVGAFGLGASVSTQYPVSNLNDAHGNASTPFGIWQLQGTETNLPPGFSGIGIINTTGYSGAFQRQEVIDRSTTAREWYRVARAGVTWSAWRERWHTGNTIVDGDGFIKEA